MDEPGRIPDDAPDIGAGIGADVGTGFDTDGDGTPDTLVTVDGLDLVVVIDLDGDRFADQVLRIGPDAVVREQQAAGGWFADPCFVDPGDPADQ